jgi:hypothetical protein
MGFLPEDHPHGKRLHLSPVDFGILKSPRMADKIRLKMSKKSSRTLRKEMSRLADDPYDGDAHALTSTEVVHAAAAAAATLPSPFPMGGDSARDVDTRHLVYRTPERFGTTSDCTRALSPRPHVNSPSVYSRSESRTDGDPAFTPSPGEPPRILAGPDFLGQYYRLLLPRRSMSTVHHARSRSQQLHMMPVRQHSRQISASTTSTVRRRLEQSGFESALECSKEPQDCSPGGRSRPVEAGKEGLHRQDSVLQDVNRKWETYGAEAEERVYA